MSRHLGDRVSGYVDRRLPASDLLGWDRHVLVCQHCRYAVDAERRVLASLRAAPEPGVSPGLHALLLQVAAAAVADPQPDPPVPQAPAPARELRLPVLPPSTPAQHRSTRRMAALVGLAASASTAAVWSFGAAPVTQATVSVSPAPRAVLPTGISAGVAFLGGLPDPRVVTQGYVARVASARVDQLGR